MRLRILQKVFGAIFGALACGLAAVGVATWNPACAVLATVFLLAGAIAVGAFEIQIRGLKAKGEKVQIAVEAIAARVLDPGAIVKPGYDMTVTSGPTMGARMAAAETDIGWTADGKCGDVRVSVASHASTLGRQIGEFSHVYSYVCVDMLGLATRFNLTKEGAGAMIGRATGMMKDANVGDASFDSMWNIDADEDVARAVLDDSIKKRLADLRAMVGQVSQDFGVGTMSIVLTHHGLAIRWPGELTVDLAETMRDLLIDMRTRMLAYEDRKAARGKSTVGYRVTSDVEAPVEEEIEEARAKVSS